MATQNPWDTLTANSSAADVASAYGAFTSQAGGDIEANQQTAIDFLRSKGVSDGLITSAYQQYLAPAPAPAPAPSPAPATTLAKPTITTKSPLSNLKPTGPLAPVPAPAPATSGIATLAPAPATSTLLSKQAPSPAPAPAPKPPSETDTKIIDWLTANPGATDAQFAAWMSANNITATQVSNATNANLVDVSNRFLAVHNTPEYEQFYNEFTTGSAATQQVPARMDEFTAWLAANPQAGDALITNAMRQFGITSEALSSQVGIPTGIINSRVDRANRDQAQGIVGGPGGSSFQQWDVAPNQTMQGQLQNVLRQDGALMQQARGQAMQGMNERGLINSSLAQQAAMEAVLGRAEGIAGPDARTFAEAANFNAGQGNAWNLAQQELSQRDRQFDKEFGLKESQFEKEFGLKKDQFQQELSFKREQLAQSGSEFGRELAQRDDQFGKELAYKYASLQEDKDNKIALMEIENKYNTLIRSDEAFNKQYAMYVDAVYQIDKDKDLGPEAKQAAKFQQARMLEDYAALRGMNLNLDFSSRFGGGGA
jgi:hypothetical protein